MNYEKELDRIVKEEPARVYHEFLRVIKGLFEDFVSGKVDALTVSNITVYWYVGKEEFSEGLILINPKVKELSLAMDITHPDYSKEKKIEIIKGLIKKINLMLKD